MEMVRQIADANWRQKRCERNLANAEHKLHNEQPDPTLWTAQQHALLQTFNRYLTAATNVFHKTLRSFEHHVKCDMQGDMHRARAVEDFLADALQSEIIQGARKHFEERVLEKVELPTERIDGGCECYPCLQIWGAAEHERIEAEQEELTEQKKKERQEEQEQLPKKPAA